MSLRSGEISLTTPDEKDLRQEVQLACFRIGSELYALDIMRIKEIIRPQKLTPIPKKETLNTLGLEFAEAYGA